MNDKLKPKTFVGLDPGMNGGIAFITANSEGEFVTKAFRCPETPELMSLGFDMGVEGIDKENIKLYAECVWAFPRDGKSSAFKFGYNYGVWNGIFSANGIDVNEVVPRKWMEYYNCPPNMDKKERKRWLKEKAIKLFPNIPITFNISDALLIANYCKDLTL